MYYGRRASCLAVNPMFLHPMFLRTAPQSHMRGRLEFFESECGRGLDMFVGVKYAVPSVRLPVTFFCTVPTPKELYTHFCVLLTMQTVIRSLPPYAYHGGQYTYFLGISVDCHSLDLGDPSITCFSGVWPPPSDNTFTQFHTQHPAHGLATVCLP